MLSKFLDRTLFALLLGGFSWAMAQEESPLQFSGFVDSYHALQREYPHDWISSRTRVRGELKGSYDNASFFVSANAIYNKIVESETGFSLNEAYLDYANDWIEVKVGKQIVVWGVADESRVTDLISPLDYTEFIANDYDDIRMAVNAVDLKVLGDFFNGEFIFVPVASFDKLPTDPANPWHVRIPEGLNLELETPEARIKNCEYGTRLRFFLEYLDFSLTALHTFNKTPVTYVEMDPEKGPVLKGVYEPMTVLGGDVSIPVDAFVIRMEAAEYLDEAVANKDGMGYTHKNTFNGVVGVDWNAPHEWTLMAQYAYKYNGDHLSSASFQISKSLLQSTMEVALSGEYDFSESGFFGRFAVQYALNDQITLYGGYDHVFGDEGFFGMYKHNSEFWAKGKFFF